ncbi:LysR family transcriptional regulator substrate-binding protein [Gordonia sputi]|uniref:LysR family transcriptional regulator substrate-binding protein n=1 Tax=Gordonia sputi TaxID=36823 RepID=UPI0027E32BE4|nr:LysR family transcriptional regulator substrate-binding protein [Gordonia sputi]
MTSSRLPSRVASGKCVLSRNYACWLWISSCVIYGPRSRRTLADRDSVSWNELGRLPLVVNTLTGITTTRSWHDPLRVDAAERQVVECTNFDEWLELIAADRGIGAVPEIAARRVTRSHVRFIPIPDAPPTMLHLAYLTESRSPTIDAFVDASAVAVSRQQMPRDDGARA